MGKASKLMKGVGIVPAPQFISIMKEDMPKQPVDDSETPDQGLSPTTGLNSQQIAEELNRRKLFPQGNINRALGCPLAAADT